MENFVTYEVGKKLKEKGYSHDYNAFGYRCIYSDECTIKFISDIGAYERGYYGEHIPCPSISEVLKWIRKEKKIAVNVEFIPYTWQYKLVDISFEKRFEPCGVTLFSDYEEAALAGIEYCLDNLF